LPKVKQFYFYAAKKFFDKLNLLKIPEKGKEFYLEMFQIIHQYIMKSLLAVLSGVYIDGIRRQKCI